MTMSFHIKYFNDIKPEQFIPIIAQSEWVEIWKPLSVREDLDWVWMVGEVGIDLLEEPHTLSQIQNEFLKLRRAIETEPSIKSDRFKLGFIKQIDVIFTKLQEIQENLTLLETAYIG